MRLRTLLLTTALGVSSAAGAAQSAEEWQREARGIFEELVEINTVTATGDTARAAEAMAARLLAGGFPAEDVKVFKPAERKGNLYARLRGTGRDPARRPVLLMAHIDVVEARREDWSTDPFELVEKDGYFYGRGTQDDKFMAAALVASFLRYKREGFRPDRDLIILLTADEETGDADERGIRWMLRHQRPLIDAAYALNEGGLMGLRDGKPVRNEVQTAEKVSVNYVLEVKNEGGHSSVPGKDNAIYRLSAALARLGAFDFPLRLNETTRAWLEKSAAGEAPALAADMRGVAAGDPAAAERLSKNRILNAQLRTTCVATLLEGGHAVNALPQTARASVNCRILPGEPEDEVESTLKRVLADDAIAVKQTVEHLPSPPSPLVPEVMRAMETATARYWPGAALVPIMGAGATDGRYLRNAGIPVYGNIGLAKELDESRAHGRDERVQVKSFYDGLGYLHDLVKLLGGGKLAPRR